MEIYLSSLLYSKAQNTTYDSNNIFPKIQWSVEDSYYAQ